MCSGFMYQTSWNTFNSLDTPLNKESAFYLPNSLGAGQHYGKEGGITLLGEIHFPMGSSDMATQVIRSFMGNPTLVLKATIKTSDPSYWQVIFTHIVISQ